MGFSVFALVVSIRYTLRHVAFTRYGVRQAAYVSFERCGSGNGFCEIVVEVHGPDDRVYRVHLKNEDRGDIVYSDPFHVWVIYDRRDPTNVALPYILDPITGLWYVLAPAIIAFLWSVPNLVVGFKPRPGLTRRDRIRLFDEAYAGSPGWDIGRPQRAFVELAENRALTGRVLDVGCGTGEHALMAAGLGLDATGIDASPTAISIAEGKALERGLIARFLVMDALDLVSLGERFDTVLDSGFFHVLEERDRTRFVGALEALIPAGGRYFMLCDRRLIWEQDVIRAAFADGWVVDAIEPARMEFTCDHGHAAWCAAIARD